MNIDHAEHICHLRLSDDPTFAFALQTFLINFGLDGTAEFLSEYIQEEVLGDEFFDDDDDDLFDDGYDDDDEIEEGDYENA
jgi:hypothetical protein